MRDELPDAEYNPYRPIIATTLWFLIMAIFGLIFAPRGPDRPLYRVSVVQAAFFMWLAWLTVYSSQFRPAEPIVVDKKQMAWMAYRWGSVEGIEHITLKATTPTSTSTSKRTRKTRSKTTTTTTTSTTTTTTTPTTTHINMTNLTTATMKRRRTRTTRTTTRRTTTSGNNTEITTTTTPRPFYYRTYTDSWYHKQYFPSKERYFEFSVKVGGECGIYLSTGKWYGYRNMDIFIDEEDRRTRCRETQFEYHFWIPPTYPQATIKSARVKLTSKYEYRRFWIDFRNLMSVKVGRGGEKNPFLSCWRAYGTSHPDDWQPRWAQHYLNFISIATYRLEADWLFHWYIEAKANYKIYPAITEPIEFGVLVERQVYREFFVLLSSTYRRVDPSILIHIGSNEGRACTITRNWQVVKFVKCKLEWHRYFYLQFWVYYRNGTISVKAGYSTPDPYPAFISWTDPEPFTVKFYGLRTVVGTQIPMSVIEVVHPEEF